jgi:hypothetical protein
VTGIDNDDANTMFCAAEEITCCRKISANLNYMLMINTEKIWMI